MKVVMYHYVRPDSKEFPHFNHLPLSVFKEQLRYFKKTFGLITKDQFSEFLETKVPCKGVIATFDDGLKDHFRYVLPELDAENCWGLFFPSTGIYRAKKLLGVHRLHMLKGKYGASYILKNLRKMLNDRHLDLSKIIEFDRDIYKAQSCSSDEYNLKRLVNYIISYEHRDDYLDVLMDRYFNEDDLFDETYLSTKEISEIYRSGNLIGSHTVSHPVLSRISKIRQKAEVEESFVFLEKITGQKERYFCYPYGYQSSYDGNTLEVLKESGVKASFVFDNKDVDCNPDLLQISRLDCNSFVNP